MNYWHYWQDSQLRDASKKEFTVAWDRFSKHLACYIIVASCIKKNDPSYQLSYKKIYDMYPEIRVGIRRAILALRKQGLINDEQLTYAFGRTRDEDNESLAVEPPREN